MLGKLKIVALALGIVGLLGSPVGLAEVGPNDAEIVIGACNVLSGPSEMYGHSTDAGINALVNKVNAEGGIYGRKLKVITDDDRYEPDGAIASFTHMQQKGAFCITGLVGSICLAKYLPMAQNFKLPAVGYYPGPAFVNDPVKRYCFTARAGYREEMKQIVKHLWKDSGVRRIAVIYQNDSFGADCLEGVKSALNEYAAEVVALGSYTRNLNNMNDAFNTVKQADPQVVILAAVYKPCVEIAKMAHDANWKPLFVVNSGTGSDTLVQMAGSDTDGWLITEVAPPPSRTDLPLVAAYQKGLKEVAPKEKPSFVSLRGYIDALVIAEGLKRTGKNLTGDRFVAALEKIHDFDIGLGKGMELSYSPLDHLGFHNVFFCQVKNGQIQSFSDWKNLQIKK